MADKIALALTGASGALYFEHFLKELKQLHFEVSVIASEKGREVFQLERGLRFKDFIAKFSPAITCYDENDFHSPLASGTGIRDYSALVVIPCSMKSIAHFSHGISDNLIDRCFDVFLKERKSIILAPRETPLSSIHLENLLKLSRCGVTILPAMPALYFKPGSINELCHFITGKILDLLRIEHTIYQGWGKGENQ